MPQGTRTIAIFLIIKYSISEMILFNGGAGTGTFGHMPSTERLSHQKTMYVPIHIALSPRIRDHDSFFITHSEVMHYERVLSGPPGLFASTCIPSSKLEGSTASEGWRVDRAPSDSFLSVFHHSTSHQRSV